MVDEIRWEVYDEWLENGKLTLRQIRELITKRESQRIDEFLNDLNELRQRFNPDLPTSHVEERISPYEKKWNDCKTKILTLLET